MTPDLFRKIVAEANLAPSTHNTQPTQWRLDGNGIVLSLNAARALPVGDPSGRDARLSMGAALFGTEIALARHGARVFGVEQDADEARMEFGDGEVGAVPDSGTMSRRTSYRAGFDRATDVQRKALVGLCRDRSDATLAIEPADIEALATLNDEISLGIMRDRAFRDELRHWMRLRPGHPMWARDGLSAEALAMSGVEALGAGVALRTPIFDILDRFGAAKAITAEFAKTVTSTGIVAFHRPQDEDRLATGRHFYDLWLQFTRIGLAAWPAAALADDPDANKAVCRLLSIPESDCLINVFRVGPHPEKQQPPKARLDSRDLIIEA